MSLLRKIGMAITVAVNALGLLQAWRWIEKLLGLGEHVEFVGHLAKDLGEAGAVLEFLLDPPPSFGLAIVIVGLGLIWWEVRARSSRSIAREAAKSEAEIQIVSFMGGGLPGNFPKEGRIYRLAVSYDAGWAGAAKPIGFNERFGPPGSPVTEEWHSNFELGLVFRCEITNHAERPLFNISMNFRIEMREPTKAAKPFLPQPGRLVEAHDRKVTISKLEPNSSFVFYAHNESMLYVSIGIPNVASYMSLGDSGPRQRPLLPTNAETLSFPPAPRKRDNASDMNPAASQMPPAAKPPQTIKKPGASQLEKVDLETVFSVDVAKRRLFLKYLPDNPERKPSDTMLALLFGYKEIHGMDTVRKSVMNSSLMDSKLRKPSGFEWLSSNMNPLDFYDADEIYFGHADITEVEKIALARGGAFRLTADGYEKARSIVDDLIARA